MAVTRPWCGQAKACLRGVRNCQAVLLVVVIVIMIVIVIVIVVMVMHIAMAITTVGMIVHAGRKAQTGRQQRNGQGRGHRGAGHGVILLRTGDGHRHAAKPLVRG